MTIEKENIHYHHRFPVETAAGSLTPQHSVDASTAGNSTQIRYHPALNIIWKLSHSKGRV